eukprot:TRINITY_DN1806_c0_g1_i1.p1 TRINITY_DN1806_c0_g1~~TRINITY_DN1806_c0_g1_i1.p1  ORF type:complete len:347 (-),score=61.94 TRINITY_DN1806_c0_g1_i1:146-1138(-)
MTVYYTPIHSFIGGLLIFNGANRLMTLNGKILGFSGILANSIWGDKALWRWFLLFGMFLGAQLGVYFKNDLGLHVETLKNFVNIPFYVMIGTAFLIGVGTQMESGCTSGHTICGVARLSKRSITATLIFFPTAMLVACYVYPPTGIYLSGDVYPSQTQLFNLLASSAAIFLSFEVLKLITSWKILSDKGATLVAALLSGLSFGFGLILSDLQNPQKVLSFLHVLDRKNFDPSLLFTVGAALATNLIVYQLFVKKQKKPKFELTFSLPTSSQIDRQLIIGSLLFGIGWGASGLCPGPAFVSISISQPFNGLIFWGVLLLAMGYKQILEKIN